MKPTFINATRGIYIDDIIEFRPGSYGRYYLIKAVYTGDDASWYSVDTKALAEILFPQEEVLEEEEDHV